MGLISTLLTLIFAAYTVLVEPFVRTNFYRNLKKRLPVDPNARILFYRTQVLWEWSWVVVLIVIYIPIPNARQVIGLTLPNQIGWLIMAALLLGIGLSTYLLRRSPGAMANLQRSWEASSVLLPSTPAERRAFAAVAVTAGVCEELLYRGFLINFLRPVFPGLDWILIALLSGIIYGLSRAYLGMRGILQTALTGFGFAIVFFLSSSLLPAMVFHILADLRPLFLMEPVEDKHKSN